jgi:hypothetical protein
MVTVSLFRSLIFFRKEYFMRTWGIVEIAAEVVCGIATVVSLVAGAKNDEDLDDRVKRIMHEEEEEN